MKVHQKIKFIRQTKGFSQEDMAAKLEMSVNGYADIERGKTDVQLSRLEQIAEVFQMDLLALVGFGERYMIYQIGREKIAIGIEIGFGEVNSIIRGSNLDLEKANLVIEQQTKEIIYLKEIIELMKK